MSGDLPADVCDLLMTQMTLLVPLLASDVYVSRGRGVDVVSDELTEAADDVLEGAASYEEVVLVLRVEESSERWQNDCAYVKIPYGWSVLYRLKMYII